MAIPVGSADWRCGAKRKGAAMPPLSLRIDEVIERAFRTTAFDDRRVSLWVMNCGVRLGWSCPLYPGEFNRSTQHYSPKLSGRGAEAILPLRTKILDTALVPRASGRRTPPIGRTFSAPRVQPASARTMSVHAPPYACRSNVSDQKRGCCVDRLNPPPESGHVVALWIYLGDRHRDRAGMFDNTEKSPFSEPFF